MTDEAPISNPYVGPRTFGYEQRNLFFGREREARDLLARVLSERLLLFYAQSGAGKSSLLYTRLIPQLQEEKGFVVLPVGRVSGELPAGVGQADNIYAFNLMLSIDEGGDPARLAHVTLSDFLARLARRTVADAAGHERKGWVYDATPAPAPPAPGSSARRYALIVDQFEEIITAHPARWREREEFFRQLDSAMRDDPNLWVVLTLREDYVAALDPYASLLADRLRARFYMKRMGVDAGLEAIRQPAALAGRPFAEGVAEQLVDNLRQVRVPGQETTIPGQYVEPVQLQVVCYQLWENIQGRPPGLITATDLKEAGDVDRALTQFYEEMLAAALADPAAGVSERQLRTWFDKELITDTGIRNAVFRNETHGRTGSLPNTTVDVMARRFLLRTELRGGGAWVELVHDRFVEPIRASNQWWFNQGQNRIPVTQAAIAWQKAGRPFGENLHRDQASSVFTTDLGPGAGRPGRFFTAFGYLLVFWAERLLQRFINKKDTFNWMYLLDETQLRQVQTDFVGNPGQFSSLERDYILASQNIVDVRIATRLLLRGLISLAVLVSLGILALWAIELRGEVVNKNDEIKRLWSDYERQSSRLGILQFKDAIRLYHVNEFQEARTLAYEASTHMQPEQTGLVQCWLESQGLLDELPLYSLMLMGASSYCEQFIRNAQPEITARSRVGLARALTGDVNGAILDLEYAMANATQNGKSEDFIPRIQSWITALQEGRNPKEVFELGALASLLED